MYALDPGPTRSALVQLDCSRTPPAVGPWWLEDNGTILRRLEVQRGDHGLLVLERMESFGMPVGREVFATVFWAGRFAQAWDSAEDGAPFTQLGRREVKLVLCGSVRAGDAAIRQALLDRYGPGRAVAIGTKASPGPLYGLRRDLWAALAVGVAWLERTSEHENPCGPLQRDRRVCPRGPGERRGDGDLL